MQEEVIREIGIILKKEIVKEGIEVIIIETEIIQEIGIEEQEIETITDGKGAPLENAHISEEDMTEIILEIETTQVEMKIWIGIYGIEEEKTETIFGIRGEKGERGKDITVPRGI